MKIELFKSALCPRCAYTAHILKNLQEELDDIEIQSFDILTDMNSFKEAGIRMIPTIRIVDAKKSWVLPSKNEIRDFILEKR